MVLIAGAGEATAAEKRPIDHGTKRARDAALPTGMTDGMEQSHQLLDGVLAAGSVLGSV